MTETVQQRVAAMNVEDRLAAHSSLTRADLEALSHTALVEVALRLHKDLQIAHRRMHDG